MISEERNIWKTYWKEYENNETLKTGPWAHSYEYHTWRLLSVSKCTVSSSSEMWLWGSILCPRPWDNAYVPMKTNPGRQTPAAVLAGCPKYRPQRMQGIAAGGDPAGQSVRRSLHVYGSGRVFSWRTEGAKELWPRWHTCSWHIKVWLQCSPQTTLNFNSEF